MADYSRDLHTLCFSFLTEAEAKALFAHLTPRSFAARDMVLVPGEPAESCLFLTSGRLAVQHNTDFAGKVQVVGLLDPGAVCGEAGILEGRKRRSTVVAIEPGSALNLARSDFHIIRQNSPELAIKILEYLLNRATLRLQKNSERLAKVL